VSAAHPELAVEGLISGFQLPGGDDRPVSRWLDPDRLANRASPYIVRVASCTSSWASLPSGGPLTGSQRWAAANSARPGTLSRPG
jgi:hypothetical protein